MSEDPYFFKFQFKSDLLSDPWWLGCVNILLLMVRIVIGSFGFVAALYAPHLWQQVGGSILVALACLFNVRIKDDQKEQSCRSNQHPPP